MIRSLEGYAQLAAQTYGQGLPVVIGTLTALLHRGDFATYELLASALFSLMSESDSIHVARSILVSITDARHYPATILPALQAYVRRVLLLCRRLYSFLGFSSDAHAVYV